MTQRHALFVAFHVPPEASSSGVLRSLKYIRYLDELGWRVTVIGPAISAYRVTDFALEAQLPSSCRVIRTRYLNTKRSLSVRGLYPEILAVPDTWIGWLPWGVSAGSRLYAADPFDLIYSTSPHATAHLIAWRIAKRTKRPWVTDFRDPWFEVPPEPGAPNGFVFRAIDKMLERRVVEFCDTVISSTLELRDILQMRYGTQPSTKFVTIPNGYDEADFADIPSVNRADNTLRVLHAGSINAEFRDPRPFFAAVRHCLDTGLINPDQIRLRFLGGGPYSEAPEMKAAVNTLGLSGIVEFLPRVSFAESIVELSRADALLLLQSSPDTTALVPAKLYEYLRAQKPVIALVQSGATGEILSAVGGGWAVSPDDTEALNLAVAEICRRWRLSQLGDSGANLTSLRRYDRKALTGQLAQIFDRLVTGGSPSNLAHSDQHINPHGKSQAG